MHKHIIPCMCTNCVLVFYNCRTFSCGVNEFFLTNKNHKFRQMMNSEFHSRDKLIRADKTYYQNQGFPVKLGQYSDNHRVHLLCIHAGVHKDKVLVKQRQRNTSTALTGCPFVVKASLNKKAKIWKIHTAGEHNHGPQWDGSHQNSDYIRATDS